MILRYRRDPRDLIVLHCVLYCWLQVKMHLPAFLPSELKVKTVCDFLVIEGNHEEKEDEHGLVTRSFRRRYILPTNARTRKEEVLCEYDNEKMLTVTVNRNPPREEEEEGVEHPILIRP